MQGQAAVELAFLLPVLVALLLVVVEGGLFLAEYVSVVNAAREGARFVIDGGTPAEVGSIVKGSSRGLITSPSRFDAWVVLGQTDGAGTVSFTSVTHTTGSGPAQPSITTTSVANGLNNTGAGVAANMRFVVVEVAYQHIGFTPTSLLPGGSLTLRSHTLLRRM